MPDAKHVNIFIAYAHADEAFLHPLRKHLAVLKEDGVSIWYDGEVLPGEEWDASIKKRLKAADIILLLVSIDFLTSDYVIGTELPTALSRHAAGECVVVPVIVRNCLWQRKLGSLQVLPKEARPVADWPNADNAYHNVVEGLDKVIEEIKKQQLPVDIPTPPDKILLNNPKNDPFHGLMISVIGGDFEMGGNKYGDGKPIHRVTIPDFYICKYPVTQGQWKQIMGENPADFRGDDNRPVEKIRWNDAQEFIKALNKLTNKRYRLPSEAEWEFAARGGNKSKRFEYSGGNNADEVAWHSDNSGDITHPVGQKKPNELGLYDMSGNVWEWCEDVWHEDYKGAPTDGSVWSLGGDRSGRVIRGGSWNFQLDHCRTAHRYRINADIRGNGIGFRLAL